MYGSGKMSQRHRNRKDVLELEWTREAAHRCRAGHWDPYSAMQDCSPCISTTHQNTQPSSTASHPPAPLRISPGKNLEREQPDVSRHIANAHCSELAARLLVCTVPGTSPKPQDVPPRPPSYPSLPRVPQVDIIFGEGGGAPQTSFERVVIGTGDAETLDGEAGIRWGVKTAK